MKRRVKRHEPTSLQTKTDSLLGSPRDRQDASSVGARIEEDNKNYCATYNHEGRVKATLKKKTVDYCFPYTSSISGATVLFVVIVVLVIILVATMHITTKRTARIEYRTASTTLMKSRTPSWPTPIIHIVNTRFMQHQGNLTTLATARLHLFRTVCFPSMLHQKNQNFLWIIKVDPFLDIHIKNEFLRIIHEDIDLFDNSMMSDEAMNGTKFTSLRERIFVIGSNTNFLTGHNQGAWRGGLESQEILSHLLPDDHMLTSKHGMRGTRIATHQSGIWSGNIEWLQKAKESEPYKIVLETRLDADDGLHSNYIEYVQNDALRKFGSFPVSPVDTLEQGLEPNQHSDYYKWYYWCAESHLKWYIHGHGERGQLDGEKRSNFCITPGLTVGFNVGIDFEDVPQYGHHELYKKLQKNHHICKSAKNSFKQEKDEDAVCLDFVKDFIAAVRSRTETSAGMADIRMAEENASRPQDEQQQQHEQQDDVLWNVLWKNFGLLDDSFVEVKKYFEQHRKQIAIENLEGQCRGDHSCKVSSRIQLKQIINSS